MAYSNSPLVTYTNISPNKTSPRNHKIDTITIHCIVGQWTAKQGCDYFAGTTRQASCNYVVGKDGSIGLCVDEKDRSWCSSSSSNDNRAVTIEVASDTSHPYAVTTKAYNSLIQLVADICKRNGIKELKWKADKSLIGQVDKQNMTVHRWFANKACPGDYLYKRHGAIANAVNVILNSGSSSTPETVENDVFIWNYFLDKIGNKYGVAGLMGNLYAESGLRSNNLQNTYETSLGYTDESYTNAVDNGSYSESSFVNDSAGYGLAQWTYYSRKQGLYDLFKSGGYSSIGSIQLACDYLWKELQNDFTGVLSTLKSATNVKTASDKVLHDFESPTDQSESVENTRVEYGVYYYNKFADSSDGGSGLELPDFDFGGNNRKGTMSLLMLAMASDIF